MDEREEDVPTLVHEGTSPNSKILPIICMYVCMLYVVHVE